MHGKVLHIKFLGCQFWGICAVEFLIFFIFFYFLFFSLVLFYFLLLLFYFSFSLLTNLWFKCKQGRRSLGGDLEPANDNIHHIRRLRKHLRKVVEDNNLVPVEVEEETNQEHHPMATSGDKQLVMKEYARPIIGTTVSCIQLRDAARNKLKNVHLTMLSSFYGISNEESLIFIRDFYATIQTFPLQGLTEDLLRMSCFSYTLKDRVKAWFMTLPPNSLRTWEAVYEKFIEKLYSHQKITELHTKIATFAQMEGEHFHKAWDRFK